MVNMLKIADISLIENTLGVPPTDLLLNIIAILVSFIAALYWVKLLRRIHISGREGVGWMWIFMSVIMILLLNISGIVLLFSKSQIAFGGLNRLFIFDTGTLAFIGTLSRTIIAISVTVGSYLLYVSIRGVPGFKFKLTPVVPQVEEGVDSEAKFKLEKGYMYMIKESYGSRLFAIDVFMDLVMHSEAGLYITRKYPPKIRDELGLRKTPIFWLSRDREYKYAINPADLVGLSEIMKEFIAKSDSSIVFLEGIEYLITQNDFVQDAYRRRPLSPRQPDGPPA
ncbi:MAG: DUF835 domain-containing protein [Candidatus Altiarchaeota archaeon]|nr:DUF835 domain-containing protein [Candidatus Altiarchaeota archaeon]